MLLKTLMLSRRLFPLIVLALSAPPIGQSYSVLTHEAIIDAAWKDNIVPLLRSRFPDSGPEDLKKAHAYAYGGAIIQDMGYYPFGNKLVSDLLHYIRSGDFVLNMIAESQDVNEYAFALGSLAHYAADSNGHRDAINRVVPLLYPKLKTRFGSVVTYADDKVSHMKVEFSFDVTEVALGAYAPEAYHDFIGFEVARALLERAVMRTYSLDLAKLMHEELAIATYRYTVSSVLPTMTKAAWHIKEKEIRKAQPSITKEKFIFNLSRSSYRKKWGRAHEKPGFGARVMAFAFSIVPKVGPLRSFAFVAPPPAAETMFMKSVNDALDQYRKLLAAQGQGVLKLPNTNFDTGGPVEPGRYRLADDSYATLLDKLQGKPCSTELRASILAFYQDLNAPFATKHDAKVWSKTLAELDALKASPVDQAATH